LRPVLAYDFLELLRVGGVQYILEERLGNIDEAVPLGQVIPQRILVQDGGDEGI
jgi:hypothetical protein